MARYLFKAAYLLFTAFLAYLGISGGLHSWQEANLSWLETYGLPAASLAGATALIAVALTKTAMDWLHKRDLRRHIRANLDPNSFDQITGQKALHYLMRESAWGWKSYAELRDWTYVENRHLTEFKEAAGGGKVITTGWDSAKGDSVTIDPRFWEGGRISREALPQAVTLLVGPRHNLRTFSQIRVATADLYWMWPKASIWLTLWARFLVHAKMRFWYGSPLYNRLEARRQREKPQRTLD